MARNLTYEQLQHQVSALQQALGEAQQKQTDTTSHLILESISNSVILTDSEGIITYANPNTYQILGVENKEIAESEHLYKLMGSTVLDLAEIKKTGGVSNIEVYFHTSNGQRKLLLINAKTVDLPTGSILFEIRDMTDTIRTENTLRKLGNLNSAVLDQAPIGIATLDAASGCYQHINQKYCDIVGYSKSELLRKDFMQLTHPDDLQKNLDNTAKLRTGEIDSYQMQKRFFRNDGKIVWVNLTVVPLWNHKSGHKFHIAMVEDITDLKSSQNEIRNRDRKYQTIVDKIPGVTYQLILHCDGNYSIPYVSPNIAKYTGIEPEQLVRNPSLFFEAIYPDDIERVKSELIRSADSLARYSIEHRVNVRKGNIMWFQVDATPTRLENNDIMWDGVALEITNRKKMEEESNKQKHLFATMFNAISDSVVITNTRREILLANKGIKDTFGYTTKELLGKTTEFLYADPEGFQESGVQLYNESAPITNNTFITHYQKKDGEMFPGETFGAKLYDDTKGWIGNLGIIRDISNRLKLESEKEAEHKQLLSIFDGMDEPIYVADPETYELLYCNDAFNEIWHGGINKKCYRVLQKRKSPCPFCTNKHIFGENIGTTHSWDFQNPAVQRWYHCIDRAIKWPDGRMVRFELAMDITDQREAELKLTRNRNRLESLWKITQIADKDLKTIADHVLIEILKFTESEYAFYGFIDDAETCLELHSWSEGAVEDCEIKAKKLHFPIKKAGVWAEAVKKRKTITINDFNQKRPRMKGTPNGHVSLERIMVVPLEMDGKVLSLACVANKKEEYTQIDEKQVRAFLGNVQLLIERKKAEQELLKTKISLEEAQRVAQIGTFEWDPKNQICWCSDEFYRICGIEKSDDLPDLERCFRNVHPNDKEELNNELENCLETGTISTSFRLLKGDTIDVQVEGLLRLDDEGQPIKLVGTIKDITEEKQFATKLQQAQKMESLGTLAGGIAHDFNNILTPIIGISEFLLDELPQHSSQYEDAKNIIEAGKRGGDLVKQILAFSSQTEHKLLPIRLDKILREVVKLIRATVPKNIEIMYDFQQDCGLVEADPVQIHQVAMNIITNAFHAVEEQGGKIFIEVKEASLGKEEIQESSQNARHLLLSISDNGPGMSADIQKNIFDPYFTTKEEGKGTGLGLSVVYGIIQEHNGCIKVDSNVGEGTTFKVYLPLIPDFTIKKQEANQTELLAGFENILLVDDEPMIAETTERKLTRLGYKVTSRIHALEALATFKVDPDKFNLVITDMAMPHMTGIQLVKEIRQINKDIPVLICTGFSNRISQEDLDELEIGAVLMKPILGTELSIAVRTAIDRKEVA